MSHVPAPHSISPDWGPELDFWVPDDGSGPDICWPKDFEVCSAPEYEPASFARGPKRRGSAHMARPMYGIDARAMMFLFRFG